MFSVTNYGPTSSEKIMILLSLWGQAMECGSLIITLPRNLTVSSSIGKCGFVVVDKALLKEICQYGGGR